MNAVLEQLRPIPLLAACGVDDVEQVHRLTERQHFFAGETILHEGGTERSLWMLLEGQCAVLKGTPGHEPRQLAVIEPGGAFGEMSFLHPAPHSATVRALTDVEVARLSPEAFESLREECPSAAYCILANLVQLLSDRLRQMDERVCEVLEHSPEDRRQEWHDFRARLFAGWDFN